MTVYKVSVVISDSNHPGAILNLAHRPVKGETLTLAGTRFQVVEVIELVPPRGDFHFLHLTCRPVQK